MKKRRFLVFVVAAAVAATGLLSATARAGKAKRSKAPIYVVTKKKMKNPKIVGTSTIDRDASGVSYSIRTKGLKVGHAYTVWVVFKQKTDSKDDKMVAFHSTGGVVEHEVANFSGRVGVGRAWDARGDKSTVRFPGEFFDPMKAMVIFRIVDHGKAQTKYLHEQLTMRQGGNCKWKGNKSPGAKPCKTVLGSKPHKAK